MFSRPVYTYWVKSGKRLCWWSVRVLATYKNKVKEKTKRAVMMHTAKAKQTFV